MFSTNVKDKIRIIENAFESDLPLDEIRRNNLAKLLGELMAEYDVQTIVYNSHIEQLSENDLITSRQSFYQFRS
jgi:hypothetical protein